MYVHLSSVIICYATDRRDTVKIMCVHVPIIGQTSRRSLVPTTEVLSIQSIKKKKTMHFSQEEKQDILRTVH